MNDAALQPIQAGQWEDVDYHNAPSMNKILGPYPGELGILSYLNASDRACYRCFSCHSIASGCKTQIPDYWMAL